MPIAERSFPHLFPTRTDELTEAAWPGQGSWINLTTAKAPRVHCPCIIPVAWDELNRLDVCFWHKADIPTRSTNVRFRGFNE
jgi:hypothetical protein